MAVGQVQRQLDRFETAGLLISRLLGKTRVYVFNPKYPLTQPFQQMVQRVYESIPLGEREVLFPTRRQPRRKSKPVIGRQMPDA